MKYLSPIPKQFVDQNGLPLSNGAVHVYISGDTQYANVYQDADGEELMPNPARLDSNGAWLGFVTAGVPMDYVNPAGKMPSRYPIRSPGRRCPIYTTCWTGRHRNGQ